MEFPKRLGQALDKRIDAGALRRLASNLEGIDFVSNDYLSFAQSALLTGKISELSAAYRLTATHGATGARLLSGASQLALDLESKLSQWLNAEASLLFNSGYAANNGLLQAIIGRNDIVLYDELSHTSIREGIRLGLGKAYAFKHNDLTDLEAKLLKFKPTADGVCYVITESLFSMDGDMAPLTDLVALSAKHHAYVIIDEAHSTGLFNAEGRAGAGLVCSLGLENEVFARIHTFGKAMGSHGAVICGSRELISYLTNFSRAFIYTTSLPPHSLLAIMAAIGSTELLISQQQQLSLVVDSWLAVMSVQLPSLTSSNSGPIQYISTPGNAFARHVATSLQQQGFAVKPVLAPTVPAGAERIRICLHAHNSPAEINALAEALRRLSLHL